MTSELKLEESAVKWIEVSEGRVQRLSLVITRASKCKLNTTLLRDT
jgi:hypothetical protein